jgi:hypothetical protein
MSFLHQRESLNRGDVVTLDCDTQCNFMLMDDSSFSTYKRGGRFTHYGGHFKRFPARIVTPRSGSWNIVVDLGGAQASIRYNLSIERQR